MSDELRHRAREHARVCTMAAQSKQITGSERERLTNEARDWNDLADENQRLRGELDRISAELGLPKGMGPASGEIARREQLLRDSLRRITTLRQCIAILREERDVALRRPSCGYTPSRAPQNPAPPRGGSGTITPPEGE